MDGWRMAGVIVGLLDLALLAVCQWQIAKSQPDPKPNDDFYDDDRTCSGLLEDD